VTYELDGCELRPLTGPCMACGGNGCSACDYRPECPGCGVEAPVRRSHIPREDALEMGRLPLACQCGRLLSPTDGRLFPRGGRA
jgi:hypothetical protein